MEEKGLAMYMSKFKVGDWLRHKRNKEPVKIIDAYMMDDYSGGCQVLTLQLLNGYSTKVTFNKYEPVEEYYERDDVARLLYEKVVYGQ